VERRGSILRNKGSIWWKRYSNEDGMIDVHVGVGDFNKARAREALEVWKISPRDMTRG
jgi:hypothetical protein